MAEPTVAVVVLTQGTRPVELRHGLESVLAQQGVHTDIVVVGNGWDPATADPALPDGVRSLAIMLWGVDERRPVKELATRRHDAFEHDAVRLWM